MNINEYRCSMVKCTCHATACFKKDSNHASTNRGARTRRAAGERCLVKQFARTDTRKNSFAVRAVDSWNELPESVRAEEKLPHFKRKLKGLAA